MADAENLGSLRDLWAGILTIGGIVMGGLIAKRNAKIDQIDDAQNAFEKKVLSEFATKDSMRAMFQETQSTIRESTARVEKQYDNTRQDITTLSNKMDNNQNMILNQLAMKKDNRD